jgi:cysteinyl-tRNA synthetase
LLGTHYRSPISFDVDAAADGQVRWLNVEDAERRLAYAYTTRSRLEAALATGKPAGPGKVLAPADTFAERFGAALDDDFNTAAAVGHTSELLTLANKLLDQPKAEAKDVRRRTLEAVRDGLAQVSRTLGVFGQNPEEFLRRRRQKLCGIRRIDPAEVERRLADRAAARQAKEFARADEIRQELAARGVEVMDGPSGSTWRVSEEQ